MLVTELNREQLTELKCSILADWMSASNASPSYSDLANVDALISDEQAFDEYPDTVFTNDDFFCTAGQ